MTPSNPSSSTYREWTQLREAEPHLRAIEVAQRLGIDEASLVASACGENGFGRAVRLDGDWAALIAKLPSLGDIKAMTRNPYALIETEGRYDHIEFFGMMGQSLGSVDLRIFLSRWKYGFSFWETTRHGERQSLQFFDAHGTAIHKMHRLPETDQSAFDKVIASYTAADQRAPLGTSPKPPPPTPRADDAIDRAGLEEAWRAMKSSHDFSGMLRKFEVERTQALRLIGPQFAHRVSTTSLETTLRSAAKDHLPIMIFVGNSGLIQIYTGPIANVVTTDEWLNVLDPHFDLHVLRAGLHDAWVVRKPTVDGLVTSLEVYSDTGEQIALLVGVRKSGQAENTDWRALVEGLSA